MKFKIGDVVKKPNGTKLMTVERYMLPKYVGLDRTPSHRVMCIWFKDSTLRRRGILESKLTLA